MSVTIMRTREFDQSLAELDRRGSAYSRAVSQVFAAIGKAATAADPFEGLRMTKHGENRIPKCLKYDLTGRCRLITVHDNGYAFLLFAGTHKSCDEWLDRNRGVRVKVRGDMQPVITRGTINIADPEGRLRPQPDKFRDALLDSLRKPDKERLLSGLTANQAAKLATVSSLTNDDAVLDLVEVIESGAQKTAIFDVLMLLKEGRIHDAEKRIGDFCGEFGEIEDLPAIPPQLVDGEDLQKIAVDSEHYKKLIEHFSRTADYREWMLFMHPDQEALISEDYAGPAKISGVSGSGKTCVVVKRAIHLANRYPSDRVLILTLNRSLASLISALVDKAAPQEMRDRVDVLPFFKLCQNLLHDFEPENDKLYDDLTWKSKEHIDEVWAEFYRCELNNFDARVLQKVHDSLIGRGIDSEAYIREEFDWIRSAVSPDDRNRYMRIPRSGRSYPMDESFRTILLDGLQAWERKMRHVGVTDYLGLSSALYRYRERLVPRYRSILVDESQDFGSIELEIVRKLVLQDENDILLCGDAAQQVSYKHQDLKSAGIDVPGARSRKLLRNYRNSREILTAAHNVLFENLTEELLDNKEFEILDPSHGYFHGPAPLLLAGQSLSHEIAAAISFLEGELGEDPNLKACLAFCGHTLLELQRFGVQYNLPVLDGTIGIENGNLFVSDLENAKGFEFQYVCIVNCSDAIIPYRGSPEDEQFRDLARLYVAMTRARTQLVVSYAGSPSRFLAAAKDGFLEETWIEYLGIAPADLRPYDIPPKLDQIREVEDSHDLAKMSGERFLYTRDAIGLEHDLIDKIRKLISGRNRTVSGRREEWRNFAEAAADIRSHPHARRLFGKDLERFVSLLVRNGLA